MAVSTIPKDNSSIIQSGNVCPGVNWYRRGNVVTLSVESFSITDTSDRTLIGQLPSASLYPPVNVFSYGTGPVFGYIDVVTDGRIQGFRQSAGALSATVSWGVA